MFRTLIHKLQPRPSPQDIEQLKKRVEAVESTANDPTLEARIRIARRKVHAK